MSTSLFAHLALRFGSHPENLATEALGYILQRSVIARGALRDLLRDLGSVISNDLSFVTQSTGDDDARPDLVGRDPSGAEPLLVEVKFWAELTKNQPVAYLERLPVGGTLLVVAPEIRRSLLWGELARRCREGHHDFIEDLHDKVNVATTNNRRLIAVSWRHLLAAMRAQVEAHGERQVADDIVQLEGLCARMDQNAFLPVTSEELTSPIYRRVAEFGNIVDDVTMKLNERGISHTNKTRSTGGNGYYGRYLFLRGVGAFLICDTRKWTAYAPTPLWLSVYGTKWDSSDADAAMRTLAPLEAEHPDTVFKAQDGFPAVALRVPIGVERDVIIGAVLEQLERVAALVAPLAIGAAESPPPPTDTDA